MVPIKTSVEDIQKLLTYLGKQIGWVDQPKIEKALGALDDRKIGAMVEFGLILRDGGNLRTTPAVSCSTPTRKQLFVKSSPPLSCIARLSNGFIMAVGRKPQQPR